MVPGISFLALIVPGFVVPIIRIYRPNIAYISYLSDHNSGVAIIVGLVFAYAVGQILFRCDPKVPDRFSIISRLIFDMIRSIVFNRPVLVGERAFYKIGRGRAEYPYNALREYLHYRGLRELEPYVEWKASDWDKKIPDVSRRSKHFINEKKLIIKAYSDKLYFEIARNEAHIRLMSSLWYMSFTSVILSVVAIFALVQNHAPANEADGPIFVAAASAWVILVINGFFHYQRVREIVFVLEIWNIVSRQQRDSKQNTRPISQTRSVGAPAAAGHGARRAQAQEP